VSTQKRTTPRLPIHHANKQMSEHDEEKDDIVPSFQRRSLLLSTFTGAYCSCCFPSSSVDAVIELTQPSTTYLPPRNKFIDNVFAQQMATGMTEYEKEVEPYKTDLFQKLFHSLGGESVSGTYVPVIVEVGMGTFPNAKYYAQALSSSSIELKGFDIVGVDPNGSMSSYAQDNARRFGLNSSLRTVNGAAEALPFADGTVDAVVTTLTLCSVVDQKRALSEIRRVLKPNSGKFLFWEHVLSEDDSALALQQTLLNPLQTFSADGCHLNRRTGMNIQKVFDGKVELNYITLEDKWVIGPTAFGIATV
jgi:SAM-dependent methyltransferase